ncbi:TROVE domain-containing protein [Haliscomenobacter sp.]|uniref:TROVE domain-containing protein n=1 Tax=Haliscomenobacter sp. TaxID=2717303 RepID=UPI003BAA5144
MLFNRKTKNQNLTTNHEGAKAWKMSPELELYSTVVTAALSDQFYEKTGKRIERIRELVAQVDPEFVAKLAVYARESMYLRNVPLVLVVELAKRYEGYGLNLVSKTIARVVQRADEITELLAYYQLANERIGNKKLNRLSKQVQKGLAQAFNKFDAYQFGKYNRNSAEVKLRDALFLTHPKAKDEAQQLIFDQIANGELAVPYTWETELSALGQTQFANEKQKQAAFRQKWEELIKSGKVGYMALLRNLRNIIEAEVSAYHFEQVCSTLSDTVQVAKAKQLPFRFLAAYRELLLIKSKYTSSALAALELAVKASVANLRGFGTDTSVLIACDVSGSMQQPISAKSKILYYDIGLMLGMLLQSKCRYVQTGMFGNTWKIINVSTKNILANVQEFYRREGEVGYSTNGYLVIRDLINRREVVDKVMIFTDVQMWSTGHDYHIAKEWQQYRETVAPNAKLYLFDLAGLGTTPIDLKQDQGVYLIAGWSDKIFDVLAALERGQQAIEVINNIEL